MLIPFLHNTTMIITFVYIFIRLKNFILKKTSNPKYVILLVPIIMGIVSVFAIHMPYQYGTMLFDLRSVPIFLASYLGSWKIGVLSAIFPSVYRYSIGGNNVLRGLLLELLLPIIVASLFHRSKKLKPPAQTIKFRGFFIRFLIFYVLKVVSSLVWGISSVPMFLKIQSTTALFSSITLLFMIIMINDANKDLLIEQRLKYLSRHDTMTTLPNLRYFKSQVENIIKNNIPVAIAMLDIDFFKNYNDTYGHPAGDVILKDVAQILKESVRTANGQAHDIIARYGGEEFIICFTNVASMDQVCTIVERIRKRIEDHPFVGQSAQPSGNLTSSFGITISLENEKSLDKLIEEADWALYRSKQKGRNCITKFEKVI